MPRRRRASLPARAAMRERAPRLGHARAAPLHSGELPRPLPRGSHGALGPLADRALSAWGKLRGSRPPSDLGRRVMYVACGRPFAQASGRGRPVRVSRRTVPVFDQEGLRGASATRTTFSRCFTIRPRALRSGRPPSAGCARSRSWPGALDGTPVRSELLSYEGPFGVGYGVAAFTPVGGAGSDPERSLEEAYRQFHERVLAETREREDAYVRLARASLESYVRDGVRTELPNDLPDELVRRRAGAFVSLKRDGRLRGCIGTIFPARGSLAEEIAENAISAGCHDPRFSPVTAGASCPSWSTTWTCSESLSGSRTAPSSTQRATASS